MDLEFWAKSWVFEYGRWMKQNLSGGFLLWKKSVHYTRGRTFCIEGIVDIQTEVKIIFTGCSPHVVHPL